MRQPPTLKICEIFPSIQGEGLRQGEPTLFVRLSGCNLRCAFCDTKYAWKPGKEITVSQIMNRLKKIRSAFPAEWTCLTGGEPLLQRVEALVQNLKTEGLKIQVETNATFFRRLDVDWYTVSPKPPDYSFQPAYKKKAREVKLVAIKGLDLDILRKLRKEFPEKIPFLLQVQSNAQWSAKLASKLLRQAMTDGLKNIRVTAQIHRIFNWR
jgi:7-carboxy-7-deazaguanine synthase